MCVCLIPYAYEHFFGGIVIFDKIEKMAQKTLDRVGARVYNDLKLHDLGVCAHSKTVARR